MNYISLFRRLNYGMHECENRSLPLSVTRIVIIDCRALSTIRNDFCLLVYVHIVICYLCVDYSWRRRHDTRLVGEVGRTIMQRSESTLRRATIGLSSRLLFGQLGWHNGKFGVDDRMRRCFARSRVDMVIFLFVTFAFFKYFISNRRLHCLTQVYK